MKSGKKVWGTWVKGLEFVPRGEGRNIREVWDELEKLSTFASPSEQENVPFTSSRFKDKEENETCRNTAKKNKKLKHSHSRFSTFFWFPHSPPLLFINAYDVFYFFSSSRETGGTISTAHIEDVKINLLLLINAERRWNPPVIACSEAEASQRDKDGVSPLCQERLQTVGVGLRGTS